MMPEPLRDTTSNQNLWGLILAGGDGTRVERLVRQMRGKNLPKQYVNFIGKRSMLEHTYERARQVIPEKQIMTIVSRPHLRFSDVRRQLRAFAKGNVIVQPANKDTGPGILLPLLALYKRAPEATVAVFPSDHFILEEERLMDHIKLAQQVVDRQPENIILLAIEPQSSETEYGYVLPDGSEPQVNIFGTKAITRFVEKPQPPEAADLVQAGGLWNTMIMVFKVKTLLKMYATLHPATFRTFRRLPSTFTSIADRRQLTKVYRKLAPSNFSRIFLAKAASRFPRSVRVLPVFQVTWSDWGSPQRILETVTALQPASHAAIAASMRPTVDRPAKRPSRSIANVPRLQRQLV